ncbi:MAG: hypothetical protein ACFB2Y_04600 [Fulvivirga sp.]
MTFRKTKNKHDLWQAHCRKHQDLIVNLDLPSWPFKNEQNFRRFATTGALDAEELEVLDFDEVNDQEFWELHDFITNYFEMDASLFDSFEQSRVKRK